MMRRDNKKGREERMEERQGSSRFNHPQYFAWQSWARDNAQKRKVFTLRGKNGVLNIYLQ